MLRLIAILATLACIAVAQAQTTCVPDFGGGTSCYNSQSGATTTVTPDFGGSYRTYNSQTGATTTTTPQFGGSYSTYDSQSGAVTQTVPDFGGGYRAYNTQTGATTSITPALGGGYDAYNNQTGVTIQERPLLGSDNRAEALTSTPLYVPNNTPSRGWAALGTVLGQAIRQHEQKKNVEEAEAAQRSETALWEYDKHTKFGVETLQDGFGVYVHYSRYQFVPNGGAVASACRQALIAVASDQAVKLGGEIVPISDNEIQLSIRRDILTGDTSCSAFATARWK
jgi:hypothetical protein